MVRVKVLKTYKSKDGTNWHLLQSMEEDVDKHTIVASQTRRSIGDELDISVRTYKSFNWTEFQTLPSNLNLEIEFVDDTPLGGYSINSIITFGMDKGYQLGIVYAFDPTYLEWCINNIGDFYINNLDQLQAFGVVRVVKGYSMEREVGVPNAFSLIAEFKSIQELVKQFGMANVNYRFKDEVLVLNQEKRKKLSS